MKEPLLTRPEVYLTLSFLAGIGFIFDYIGKLRLISIAWDWQTFIFFTYDFLAKFTITLLMIEKVVLKRNGFSYKKWRKKK